MHRYFFILGTNPALSIAELSAVLDLNNHQAEDLLLADSVFVVSLPHPLDCYALIKRLGGTIKIGEAFAYLPSPEPAKLIETIKNIAKPKGRKYFFGFSVYGEKLDIKPLAMSLKNRWKEQGIASRWVVSRTPALSSVVVEQNKLLSQGAEIVLIKNKNQWLIGRTLAVQPFKELSARDYGRPARDDRSGMLPPKLAQIMINLALSCPAGDIPQCRLLDPFCGSGTILTEAMLMGYRSVIGADISAKAIDDARSNINWINKNYKLQTLPTGRQVTNYKLYTADARKISQHIPAISINAIITEPYLGPQRGRFDLITIKKELEKLYSQSLKEFKKILKTGGRIVMVWPVFRTSRIAHRESRISPDLNGFQIINPIPIHLRQNKNIKLTDRQTIIYGRSDQKVWREIVVLK